MSHRIWKYGVVWSCLALAASPSWAQFGGGSGAGGGAAVDGIQGYDGSILGIRGTIDLKAATLGQVVELIQKTNGVTRIDLPADSSDIPVSILIPDKLKELNVGDIVLTNVTPAVALASISKGSNGAFTIEAVSGGLVLVLKSAQDAVVVKAIRLPWMEQKPSVSAGMGEMGAMMGGGMARGSEPETAEQRDEALKQHQIQVKERTQNLLKAIDAVFEMHAKLSGRTLPAPLIQIQAQLSMVMVVGSPESVQIASEIINATNPDYVPTNQPGMGGAEYGIPAGAAYGMPGGGLPGASGGGYPGFRGNRE